MDFIQNILEQSNFLVKILKNQKNIINKIGYVPQKPVFEKDSSSNS